MIHLDPSPPSLEQQLITRLANAFDPSGAKQSDYEIFKQKYWDDPAGFAKNCIMWERNELSDYQEIGMIKLVEGRRFSLRGPHGLGKTAFAALIILWFALTRDGKDWKVPTLASSWRQIEKYLWPEIHKWSNRLRWDKIGRSPFDKNRELLQLNLKLSTGFAFAMASNDHALIEGAHADHILYVFDESKSIPNETWDAAEGAMSSGDCMWLAISTPGEMMGRFYDIHSRKRGLEDWTVLHVTLKMAIDAGRINEKWAKQRKLLWGEESAIYKNRVLGDFAAADEDTVIPLALIEAANERWHLRNAMENDDHWGILFSLGVDIGRGGDPSVIAERWENPAQNTIIRILHRFHEKNVMPLAGRIVAYLRRNNYTKAILDVIGIGAGAFDRIKESDDVADRCFAFIAGAKITLMDESETWYFVDARSYGYWRVRELLQHGILDLPPDDTLTGDLTTPKYEERSGGKIKVESKEEIKKRLGRSTDDGDAVIMSLMDDIAIDTGEPTMGKIGAGYRG